MYARPENEDELKEGHSIVDFGDSDKQVTLEVIALELACSVLISLCDVHPI